MFDDRKDAGIRLAGALERFRGLDVVVLAIPRGGIEVGIQVASHLGAEFDVVICRKLPYPEEPEAGFGAVAEDGTTVLQPAAREWLSNSEIQRIKREQMVEIKRRLRLFRKNRPLPDLRERTVILVDDGLAVGSTMRAAVGLCRNRRAGRVIVAVPVSGRDAVTVLGGEADEVVALEIPSYFRAVAQVYRRWRDVSDAEALDLLSRVKSR
jgi:putative phosphoribosyl transferase